MDAKARGIDTSDREIVLSRAFDAPRTLVWRVWTDPAHIGQWWGPRGFTTTIYAMEVKPGGLWRYTMHGPDGTDYPNWIRYREVVAPERLAYDHGDGDGTGPAAFEVVTTFEEVGGKTLVTMRSLFPTAAARDHVIKAYGAIEGGKQTLERLGEHLAALTGSSTTG